MIKYIVKETSKATADNEGFTGNTLIAYHGKDSKTLGFDGDHCDATHLRKGLDLNMVKWYGYNRRCDAERNLTFRSACDGKYWKSTAEIIEVAV